MMRIMSLLTLLTLAACNTVAWVGEDISAGANKVSGMF
jgi:predicted small secreted protein